MLLIRYLIWQFIDSPKQVLKAWGNFLYFNFNFFSVPLLLKTFFSHWHKYSLSYGKSFSPWLWVEAFVFNMFSRTIGVILRTFFIIIGIIIELLIVVIGLFVFLSWIVSPLLIVLGVIIGFKLILF